MYKADENIDVYLEKKNNILLIKTYFAFNLQTISPIHKTNMRKS